MTAALHPALLVAVIAVVTIALRALPFALFRERTPAVVVYLGRVLPYAMMAMLVVYCLRGVSLSAPGHGLPEALAVGTTAALHKWRHNTLLSILAGTLLYMFLVQSVF